MNRDLCFVALSFSLFLFPGCRGNDGRPEDLPPLFPVTITVTQGEEVLEGAHVELVPQDSPNQPYRATATTDANGVAIMKTYGFPDSPAGNHKIIVRKGIVENIVYGRHCVLHKFAHLNTKTPTKLLHTLSTRTL